MKDCILEIVFLFFFFFFHFSRVLLMLQLRWLQLVRMLFYETDINVFILSALSSATAYSTWTSSA